MLFITLFVLYLFYLVHVLGYSFSYDWAEIGDWAESCGFYYVVGYSVWFLGRRKVPSLDKTGKKLFSVFLFVPGIALFIVIVLFAVLSTDLSGNVLAAVTWAHIGFGAIAFGLMGLAVLIWRRARTTSTMDCPFCHHCIPVGSDSCPQCGHQIKQDTQKSEFG